ncbi:hypothetical protein [Nocardioides jishulii]|uniref:Uncharacterized protein n=1 Tax=Nocardioides jishulii TaxID=2575440 RepID=A0A4V6X610_9ACTN|nr:hypothetical protein [Nocardioides jishulii]QCX26950.1 hypothetical protein FCL41_04950 [Nocardioides jishulii]TKI61433.1 hypothetical protein FC770_11585 [Nocardioides jishulii]
MSNKVTKFTKHPTPPLAVAAIACAVTVWALTMPTSPTEAGAAPEEGPLEGSSTPRVYSALDVVASTTVTDWVKAADHVVAVSVIGEERVPPGRSETSPNGEGMVDRLVTLRVINFLWSADEAEPLGKTVTAGAYGGWFRLPNGVEEETTVKGSPRLEVGHDYVVALAHRPALCLDGRRIEASWAPTGTYASVPADQGVIGSGEFEGVSVAATSKSFEQGTVVSEFAGAKLTDLSRELALVGRVERTPVHANASTCE